MPTQPGVRFASTFCKRAIDLAVDLDAPVVSLWSGALAEPEPEELAFDRLTQALEPVLHHAEDRIIQIGFEPEPGMFIDTMARFRRT